MPDVTVTFSGPLFDGRADIILQRAVHQIRESVAYEGVRLARSALIGSIRHPGTGYAVRSVTMTAMSTVYQTGKYTMPILCGPDETIVTTENAMYGPWLEGTGSRNDTTRFKGYHSFRLAAQALDAKAGAMAEELIKPYIEEMNR